MTFNLWIFILGDYGIIVTGSILWLCKFGEKNYHFHKRLKLQKSYTMSFQVHISFHRADLPSHSSPFSIVHGPRRVSSFMEPTNLLQFWPWGPPPGIREWLGFHVYAAPGLSTEAADWGANCDVLCLPPPYISAHAVRTQLKVLDFE